jgi:hypothetical protein
MSSSPDGPVVKPVLAQLEVPRVTSANKALEGRHGPNADVGSMQADIMHVALAFPTAVRWCQKKKHAGRSGLGSALLPCGTGCCPVAAAQSRSRRMVGSDIRDPRSHEQDLMNFTKKPSQRIRPGGCNGSCAVSATSWTAILSRFSMVAMRAQHEQVSDSCIDSSKDQIT